MVVRLSRNDVDISEGVERACDTGPPVESDEMVDDTAYKRPVVDGGVELTGIVGGRSNTQRGL